MWPNAGTTSAYAENTESISGSRDRSGNYLRVRGEYEIKPNGGTKDKELPPRTRRIPAANWLWTTILGTTSAYAENTPNHYASYPADRNYLRVRGEYRSINNATPF